MIIYVLKLQTEKIRFFNASKNDIQGVIAESWVTGQKKLKKLFPAAGVAWTSDLQITGMTL